MEPPQPTTCVGASAGVPRGIRIHAVRFLETEFDFFDQLAQGAFGAAHLVKEKSSGQHRVLEAVRPCGHLPPELLSQGMDGLKSLDHPNVVRMLGYFQDYRYVCVLMEPVDGGTLLAMIQKIHVESRQALSEAWCAQVFNQCFSATAYCHGRRVSHKSITGESIMVLGAELLVAPHVMIIGFGVAEVVLPVGTVGSQFCVAANCASGARLRGRLQASTCATTAPEVWMGDFGPKCDVFSLGCVLFQVLSGRRPFMARNIENASEWILLHKQGPDWRHLSGVSRPASQLCERTLVFDERLRPMAQHCLRHSWFSYCQKGCEGPGANLDQTVVEALCQWRDQSNVERSFHTKLAASLKNSIPQLTELFRACGVGASDGLSLPELVSVLRATGIDEACLQQLEQVLHANSAGIDYTTFVASTLRTCESLLDDCLWAEFTRLDQDCAGHLSREEFMEVLQGMGVCKNIDGLMSEIDTSSDGRIYFDDLLNYLTSGMTKSSVASDTAMADAGQHSSVSVRDEDLPVVATPKSGYDALFRDSPDVDALLGELERTGALDGIGTPDEIPEEVPLPQHKPSTTSEGVPKEVADALVDHAVQDADGTVSVKEFSRWSAEVCHGIGARNVWDDGRFLNMHVADADEDARVDRAKMYSLLDALNDVTSLIALRSLAEAWCAMPKPFEPTRESSEQAAQIDALLEELGL
mmetsp:Transcript_89586/g.252522  ORF Transcript_89586/g.252522 Transcript_89586/m.252522 type:complete len:697 (+) Transcript_89586:196-2286(+)